MGDLFQRVNGLGCGLVVAVGLWCGVAGAATAKKPVRVSPWEAAVTAREQFEAEPAGTHTKAEYADVMDRFRAIYHGDPGDAHAARAVEQVAELLVEQGTELADKKSLKDAAGQYDFLAKAYPAYAREEKKRLASDKLGGDEVAAAGSGRPEANSRFSAGTTTRKTTAAPVVAAPVKAAVPVPPVRVASAPAPVVREEVVADPAGNAVGPMAMVTGIRHWSTPTYTRVAIDLSGDEADDLKFEAARVVNPDRIYFDLHHARLGAGLAGKTFSITDDGFLTKIRAAQSSDDVTRVVLDVHAVGEYSAFLLPNPERLIIDIHGKAAPGDRKQEAGSRSVEGDDAAAPVEAAVVAAPSAPVVAAEKPLAVAPEKPSAAVPEKAVAVVAEKPALVDPEKHESPAAAVEVSSLPPMPVTDGSAGFGLPAKNSVADKAVVAQPRVVVPLKPTVAKPVPNTVAKSSTDTGSEVAAVSRQPGKVEATTKPTSQPVSSGQAANAGVSGDHYVPRSKRKAAVTATPTAAHESGTPVEAPLPTADGETSLVRALGLKIGRIVIDAGHGGHDSGTLGAGGIQEKDVVLDVALRLGKLLHDRLGAEVVYTRADDTFIPLETRTAIANKAQADLFISVHANSSPEPSARGVEVYYLNFTSDPEAMTVASRENAVSTQSVHELSDLVKKIALKDKIEESKELAGDVDASLYAGLKKGNEGLKDRGVKKAPFVVLIGANMPSILAEISFVTNPDDAEQLRTPEYRERVAESLYGGVARYAAGINGGAVKSKPMERAAR
jgi:N-acetylmuramoyl-L-alanine amidase